MGTDNRKGILYAIFTASLWGFMAIILKVITYELSPITVVWFRFFFAFLVLGTWTLIFRRNDFRIFLRPPALLLLAALFLALNYTGFIAGIKYVSPSASQIFIQIAPVSFALSGIIIFREHVNWQHILGFILVLAGIGLFYSEQLRDLVDVPAIRRDPVSPLGTVYRPEFTLISGPLIPDGDAIVIQVAGIRITAQEPE